jgi:hypothetical protein
VPKFHAVVKTTAILIFEVTAKSDREAAERIVDGDALDDSLHYSRPPGLSVKNGVRLLERSHDEGSDIEVEISPIEEDGTPDFMKAQYFLDTTPEAPLLPENRCSVVRVSISEHDNVRTVTELPDPKPEGKKA